MWCVAAVEGDEAAGGEGCEGGVVWWTGFGGIGGYMAAMGVGRESYVARELIDGMAGFQSRH